jgi:phenylalanyl-tRNA synthetase beta chain
VTVPDTRPDLHIQADLNEEVGRIHGYEHVVAEAPSAALEVPRENPVYTKGFAVRRALAGAGLDEVYLGIWVGEEEVETFSLDKDRLLELKNPLASNLCWFRPTALPDVLGALHLNRKNQERVGLFEIAKIYWRGEEGQVVERHHISGGLSTPGKDEAGARFYTARDAVVGALEALGTEPALHRGDPAQWMMVSCFHPGRVAMLSVEGVAVAIVGELHPSLVGRLGLEEAPVTFHVDLEALLPLRAPIRRFVPPPRFPSVEYHLNVLAPEKTWAEDVLSLVSKAQLAHLQTQRLQAVYTGQGVPEGRKRLTLELVFNHPERSLTHEEARTEMERLRPHLEANGLDVEM